MRRRVLIVSTVVAGLLALIGGAPAEAQRRQASREWYVGATFGDADLNLSVGDFDDGSITSGRIDNSDDGIKAFFGLTFGRAWTFEGGWVDFRAGSGDATFSGNSDGTGSRFAAGSVTVELEPEGFYAALVGNLFRTRSLRVFGKIGYMAWETDRTTTDANGTVVDQDDGTDLLYGVGAEFRLTRVLAARAEWERFTDVAGDDVDLASIGIALHFGGR